MSIHFSLVAQDILTRALWAAAILLAGLLLYALINRVILARAQHNSETEQGQLPFTANGAPTILYFTTPDCVPCKTVQRPALRKVQERLGERLQVIEVNAVERPELARQYGVLSVPTTFIIDANGQLRHVNHGVTRAEKLLRQLETVL